MTVQSLPCGMHIHSTKWPESAKTTEFLRSRRSCSFTAMSLTISLRSIWIAFLLKLTTWQVSGTFGTANHVLSWEKLLHSLLMVNLLAKLDFLSHLVFQNCLRQCGQQDSQLPIFRPSWALVRAFDIALFRNISWSISGLSLLSSLLFVMLLVRCGIGPEEAIRESISRQMTLTSGLASTFCMRREMECMVSPTMLMAVKKTGPLWLGKDWRSCPISYLTS